MRIIYKVLFKQDRCKGCKLCEISCPKKIISMSNTLNVLGYNFAQIKSDNVSKCIGCGFCFRMCPDSVITIIDDKE